MYNFETHTDRFLAITNKAIKSKIRPDKDDMKKGNTAVSCLLAYHRTAEIAELMGQKELPEDVEAKTTKALNDYEDSVTLLCSVKG